MSRSSSSLEISAEERACLLSLYPEGVVAVDLETTGLSPLVDKIIEIAAFKINKNGEVFTYHQLINPLVDIPESSTKFHGLTNKDLKNCPTIKKPLKAFWDFSERLPLIAHNSTFDLGHLIKASHDFQIEFPPLNIFDSCRYARAILKKQVSPPKNYKLSTLSEYVGFKLQHHIALDDTLACLKIMAYLAKIKADHKLAGEKSFVFRLSQFNSNTCFNFSTRLNKLISLVQDKELIELYYRGKSSALEPRPVRPIGLLPLPKGPVLFAECLKTKKNKSFILKKIKSYKKLSACLLEGER